MGSITQASLAWLKATWKANEEDDFSHYELKYKKTAYSDFGLVTTTDITFIWTGLEQNIEYQVYIRAVDIYGNRSAWSGVQTQITATDSETPDQVSGAVASALLAGIKVTWDRSSEDNIAGYAVERQESDDGTTWTGEWTERVRTDTTMWLDLLLTYTKFYRYRIKAFTQTGTEGGTSTSTADSIAPNKMGTNDIVANAITADLIAANSIYTNAIQSGAVTADRLSAAYIIVTGAAADVNANVTTINGGKITANTITITQLNFVPVKSTDVIARINASAEGIRIDADNIYISGSTTFQAGYNPTGKIAAGGAAADVNAYTTTISGGKITTNTITVTQLNFVPVKSTDVIARINTSAEGIRIDADNIYISGSTTFQAGYNPTGKIAAGGAAADVNAYTTTISGGKITTNTITANKINVSSLAAIQAILGTVHAGLIYGTRIQVGGGTNEDIYFEDSGVRMYDAGNRTINMYKSGYKYLQLALGSTAGVLSTDGKLQLKGTGSIEMWATSGIFVFHSTGTLEFPILTSAPTAHSGDVCIEVSGGLDSDKRMHYHTGSEWQYLDDNDGW